jgi:kynurenine formamidase
MQIYPGDTVFACTPTALVEKDGYSVHSMTLGSHTGTVRKPKLHLSMLITSHTSHTGTHVDAPYHFFANGNKIDEIPLSTFIGQALVIDLTTKGAREIITWADLAPHSCRMHDGVIVLLRTGWSAHWKTPRYYDHPFVSREAAEGIMATGVRVLGVDTLSPDETLVDGTEGKFGFGAHQVILGCGGVIAENLTNLDAILDKNAIVSLVPLNLLGCDGSPIRAFASVSARV